MTTEEGREVQTKDSIYTGMYGHVRGICPGSRNEFQHTPSRTGVGKKEKGFREKMSRKKEGEREKRKKGEKIKRQQVQDYCNDGERGLMRVV